MGFIKKALGTISIIISMRIGSGFAANLILNKYNIESEPYNCSRSATYCNLNNLANWDYFYCNNTEKTVSISADTFINHTNLTGLSLKFNHIVDIGSGIFNGLTNLKSLDLSFSCLKELDYINFSPLQSLETLYIQGSSQQRQGNSGVPIKMGTFSGLNNLKELKLAGNRFTGIEDNTFADLINLEYLDLSSTRLTTIHRDILSGLNSLRYLDLHYVGNLQIQSGAFTDLTNLTGLDLSDNSISNLGAGSFGGLDNLEMLNLKHANIQTIGTGVFDNLNALKTLNLSSNRFTTLPINVFSDLSGLTKIDLTYGYITSISEGMFNGLSNISDLDLRRNNISSIGANGFNGLSNISSLNLSENNISSIEANGFSGLSNISYLNLRENNISSIEANIFNGLSTLKSIYLTNNQIDYIESGAFNGLSLDNLSLASNKITQIGLGMFNGASRVDILNLSNNQISYIESGALENQKSQLDLSKNQLSSILKGMIPRYFSNGGRLSLDYNQISYIEPNALPGSYNGTNRLYLNNNKIEQLDWLTFSGNFNLNGITLSYNPITRVINTPIVGSPQLSSITLNQTCTYTPITVLYNTYSSITDGNYCGIINSAYTGDFINTLITRGYTGDSSLLIGTGTISFERGITNSFLAKTIMRSENTNNYTGDYYSDTVEVQYPINTTITKSGNIYTGLIHAPYLFSNKYVPGLTGILSLTRFGSLNEKVNFDKNITVRMPARGKSVGDLVAIYSAENEVIFGSSPANRIHEKTIRVVSLSGKSYIEFTTNHGGRWALSSDIPPDNTPPVGTITYSNTGSTNGNVTAILTTNEEAIITNNGGSAFHIFTGNGEFIFEFRDNGGNDGSATASVDWILSGAFELNSGNVTDFCETGAIFCIFENTNISSIAAKTFLNHQNLEQISFQSNSKLTNIESGAFVGVPETLWLIKVINNRNLTSIKNGALSSLPNITQLYLENNGINSIESGSFIGNYSLEYLFLSGNNISNIKSGTFRDLEGLKELHIENNNISSINSGDFIGLSNIEKLGLNDNHLNAIKEDDLINLHSAKHINLKNNQISYIDINSFQGMNSLISVDLQNNQVSSIDEIFKDMPALTSIYLNNNHILKIDPNTFNNIPSIHTIKLNNNNIINAEGPILDSANHLRFFDLTKNCHYDPLTSVYDSYNTGYYYFIQYGITGSSSAVYSTNCALIKSINPNTFIAELKLRGYTGDSSILLGTGAIRFKGQNKILVNTIMYDLQDYSGIEDRTVEVEYPSNTSISKNGLAFSEVLNAPTLFDPTNAPGLTGGAISLMRFGSLQGRIDFDKNITIRMPAYGKDIGDIIGIYSSEDESIYAPDGGNRTYEKTGTVIGLSGRSYVEFTTNHASRWALGDTPDITAPIGTVSYSNTNPTSGNVIATVTLNETGVITNNGGNSYYVFTGNGTFTFEFRDIAGNTGTKIATVSNIDKTGPIGDISYSTTEPINAIVVATLTLNESGVITNNSGENTVAFASNGNFTFQFRDTLGNTGIAIATVSNIDKNLPPGSITYSTKTPTSGNVTAILTLSETGTITNNGGSNTYIFSDNGSFTFEFLDNRGDSRSITASVSNIDRTRPIGTISYSTTNVTNENVTATLMLNETGTITSIGGNSHMFTNNGNFTFTFIDLAGNTGSVTANVNWINPDWRITFNITGNTNNNVISTIHFKDTGTITNNGGLNSYTFTNNGSFTFEFIDKTGRNNSEIVNVNWIDKTSPMGSISYSTTGYISGDVTATLALNEIGTITNNNGSNIYTFKDNGSFTFEFRDLAGNTGSTTAVVNSIFNGFIGKTRDNKIVTSGGIYNTGIIFTFNDNNGVAATVDGNIYKSGSIISSEGINKDFILTDKDGNTTGMIFSIDTTKPICSTNSESIYSGIYLILNWNCTDNNDNDSGLSGIMLVIKDATDKVMYSSGLDISTREINYYTDSGKYNWEIIAEDKAGNKTVVKSNSNYHKTLDMTITYPGTLIDDTYYTNNPNITIKMVANMWLGFEVIGDTKNITTQGYVTGTLNKNIDLLNENGFNEIKINYLSLEESGSIGPISFYIDSIKPKITSLYPTPLLNITGTTMDFSRTANDTGAGISGYILTLTKNNYTNVIYTGQESSYRADKLSNGTYTWKVSAIDYAGNIDETETQTFKISSTVTIDDVSPDEFTLTEQNDRKVYYKYKSNKITVTGLSENVEIIASVNSGTLIINGTESGTSGYVQNGDKIQIEIYSSREFNDTTSGVLTIGDKSGTFILTTIEDESGDSTNAYDITELSTIQKLRIGLIYNSLSKLYKDSAKEDFMVTLKALIKDKIDKMEDSNKPIQSVETMKYLYNLINKDYEASEIDTSNISYIAPNSKEYSIKYIIGDGYTSPNFIRSGKYFDTLNEIKKYIDTNNPKSPYRMVDFSIDTNRDKVDYIAPNGKKYIIFKTTDDRYGSNNFIYGKLFKGLSEIKKYIDEKNT